ncbi:hypothetical protein ABH931_007149 [Streptacidiphilus sp. MAP12-33]|uniref:hypothetical protein n=1 Tax=Streptacidiphilus sp. MAP12-33 TaxID=3156266 RepID=UPI0035136A94
MHTTRTHQARRGHFSTGFGEFHLLAPGPWLVGMALVVAVLASRWEVAVGLAITLGVYAVVFRIRPPESAGRRSGADGDGRAGSAPRDPDAGPR